MYCFFNFLYISLLTTMTANAGTNKPTPSCDCKPGWPVFKSMPTLPPRRLQAGAGMFSHCHCCRQCHPAPLLAGASVGIFCPHLLAVAKDDNKPTPLHATASWGGHCFSHWYHSRQWPHPLQFLFAVPFSKTSTTGAHRCLQEAEGCQVSACHPPFSL
jgi:hypothetical protein